MINNLKDLIKFIYNYSHPDMVKIWHDRQFGDEKNVLKLVNKLLQHNLVSKVNDNYSYITVKVEPLLLIVVNDFNCDLGKYLEFINQKESLEIDKLKYEKENKALRDENLKLSTKNLKLRNWDIRFRWYISALTFIIGLITESQYELLNKLLKWFVRLL